MFSTLKKLWANTRAEPGPSAIVMLAVSILLIGLLVPIGLTAMEAYTPTDPTLVIVWPIVAVLICVGLALKFIPRK